MGESTLNAAEPRRARTVSAALIVSIVASVVTVTAGTPALAATPLPQDLEILLSGGGWGHGHGMSQYGARAQAGAGRTYQQILDSYYSGVSIVNRGQETMRVLVGTGSAVTAGGPEQVTARRTDGSRIATSSSTYPYLRARSTSAGLAVERAASRGGPWRAITTVSGRVRFSPTSVRAVPIVESGGALRYYRGFVEAYRRSSTALYAINQLRMDHYLYGVVPREMPASWHAVALRAQAVAARSYSSWKRANAPSSSPYHICATTACQVYGGYATRASASSTLVRLENARTNDAIGATAGMTMVSGGAPIFAEFHSSSGGHTSQGTRSYLAPVADPWDAEYSPHHRWEGRIAVAAIERKWPAVGRLVGIARIDRDGDGPWGGRVESLDLVGTASTVTVSGNAFRSAFSWPARARGIRSTLFSIGIYDAAVHRQPGEVVLQPGQTGTAVVRLLNQGNRSWPVGSQVRLGTSGPKNRVSQFADASWVTSNRPGYVTADLTDGGPSVSPGQVAEFRFPVSAPAGVASGSYLERFRATLAGVTWFGPDVTVPVRVAFAGAAHLGANLATNASFESINGTAPAGWDAVAAGSGAVAGGGIDGTRALKVVPDPAATRGFRQTLAQSGPAGETVVVSAWNRSTSTSASGGAIEARAELVARDGSVSTVRLDFPRAAHAWTHREARIVAPTAFEQIRVQVLADRQSGSVWFDRVRVVRDRVANGSFEAGSSPSSWTIVNATRSDGRETSRVRAGAAALRLVGSASVNKYARQYLDLSGPAGDRLRLSGWSRSERASAGGGPVSIWIRLRHADGSTQDRAIGFPRAAHDWGYGEITVVAAEPYVRVGVYARYANQTGTGLFDEIALARAPSAVPLSANHGFELGSPQPGEWSPVNAPDAAVSSSAAAGDASLHLSGSAGREVYARQYLPVAGSAGDRYTLSGYNRTSGSSVEGGPVRIWARIVHVDGTTGAYAADFSRAPHAWRKQSVTFTAEKPYRRVDVFARYADQTGDAWFDEIALTRA